MTNIRLRSSDYVISSPYLMVIGCSVKGKKSEEKEENKSCVFCLIIVTDHNLRGERERERDSPAYAASAAHSIIFLVVCYNSLQGASVSLSVCQKVTHYF